METLELREYIQILYKRLWMILSITLAATILSGIISLFFLEDVYSTSTTLIVSKTKDGAGYNETQLSDVTLSRNLVNTYNIIMKSDRVLERVIYDLNLEVPASSLRSKVSVNSENNTEIIRITVQDRDPLQAKSIANAIALVFQKEVKEFLRMDNVQIIDQAKVPGSPIKPNPKLNIIIAAFLGFMVSMGLIFLIEYLDNTIKTPDDVQRYLDLPILGTIPRFED